MINLLYYCFVTNTKGGSRFNVHSVVTRQLIFLLKNICLTRSEIYTIVLMPSVNIRKFLCLLDSSFNSSFLASAFAKLIS